MRTVYIDVSDTVKHRLNTGIQRVVRRMTAESMAVAAELGVAVVPVVTVRNRLARLNAAGLAVLQAPRQETGGVDGPMIGGHGRLKRLLKRFPAIYGAVRREALERRGYKGLLGQQVTPSPATDLFMMIDSFWVDSSSPGTARRLARRGVPVVAMIYDVIPLTTPGAHGREVVAQFSDGLQQVIDAGAALVSISKNAAREVAEVATARGYPGAVESFYLGFDPQGAAPASERQGIWPDRLWDHGAPVHLMVGTIEPRKGVATVLAAMTTLWDAGGEDRLLIVGRLGWGVEELAASVRSHPQFGRRLFMIHDAEDAMLADAYDRASDIVMASTSEGFGLPLIEGLSKGLPVVASDIAVFRELAGDVPVYFRKGEPSDLVRALEQMAAERDTRREAARQFRWMNWREAARQFMSGVIAIADRRRTTEGKQA